MTKRAERLAEYLEARGWHIWEHKQHCVKCGYTTKDGFTYCPFCAALLEDRPDIETAQVIENALEYALKDDNTVDGDRLSESFVD